MLTLYKKPLLIATLLILNSAPVTATENNSYNLQQAIDHALIYNPNLQIMQERIAQAEAQLDIALSSFYPSITTRLSYTHTTNPSRAFGMIISQRRLDLSPNPSIDFNNPGGIDNYRPEVTARYSLFRGGQDYYNSKAAQLDVEAATLNKSAVRNQLIQTVSSTFYAYLASIEIDHVSDRSIEAVKNELKQSKNKYLAGSLLKSDVLTLQVQLAEAQDIKIQTSNAIELSKTSLKSLLGITAGEAFDVNASTEWTIPQIDNNFRDLLTVAMNQRPEIQAANKQIVIAKQQLNAAKGAYLPKADAYVSYGSDSKDLDYNTNRDNVTAGVIVELDIFSGFRNSSKIKKAEHQLAIAQKSAKQTQLIIEKSVKSAHLKAIEALTRIKVTSSAVIASEEALRLVNEQRKAGTVTVTRYIEAEVARDKSHARDIAAKFDALRAEAELNRAIGVWK